MIRKDRGNPAVITAKWKEQEWDRELSRNNIQKFLDRSINPLLWKAERVICHVPAVGMKRTLYLFSVQLATNLIEKNNNNNRINK